MRLRPTPETDCIVRNAANNHHPTSRLAATLTVKCERLERERDEARIQYRSTEALGMALVNSINKLKEEKAELVVKLVNLQGRSRPATLEEIRDSVREKYDPEYELGGRDDE